MPALNNFNICISARDDTFVPDLNATSRLLDFLDAELYLEGPDREFSRLVILPARESQSYKSYLRLRPNAPVPPVRRRYVNLLYPPTIAETGFKSINDLRYLIENIRPSDATFVVSLGRSTRRLYDIVYIPRQAREEKRWLDYIALHILRGYHGLWDIGWSSAASQNEWELKAAKGFTLMLSCKVNTKADPPSLAEYLKGLRSRVEFQAFIARAGREIGVTNFELIGEHAP